MCYKITTTKTPTDHAMGPWCPTNATDDASKGGLWFEKGTRIPRATGGDVAGSGADKEDGLRMMLMMMAQGVGPSQTK